MVSFVLQNVFGKAMKSSERKKRRQRRGTVTQTSRPRVQTRRRGGSLPEGESLEALHIGASVMHVKRIAKHKAEQEHGEEFQDCWLFREGTIEAVHLETGTCTVLLTQADRRIECSTSCLVSLPSCDAEAMSRAQSYANNVLTAIRGTEHVHKSYTFGCDTQGQIRLVTQVLETLQGWKSFPPRLPDDVAPITLDVCSWYVTVALERIRRTETGLFLLRAQAFLDEDASGSFDLAMGDIESAIELSPNLKEAHYAKSMVLKGLGRESDSERAFRRGKELEAMDNEFSVSSLSSWSSRDHASSGSSASSSSFAGSLTFSDCLSLSEHSIVLDSPRSQSEESFGVKLGMSIAEDIDLFLRSQDHTDDVL